MASTEKIKLYLEQFGSFPGEDWDLFESKLLLRTFKKKEIILATGRVEDYVSFIESGIVRFFVRKEEEKEITFEIGFENSLAAAYDSFLTREPVFYNAEALTDTVLWSVSYSDLQEIYALSITANKIGRLAAEALYIKKNKRQVSLLRDTAEERYTGLLKDYPHLVQHIPLKYLASYIGITPQALSRIRRRIA